MRGALQWTSADTRLQINQETTIIVGVEPILMSHLEEQTEEVKEEKENVALDEEKRRRERVRTY